MSALYFTLNADVPERLDLSPLTPSRLAGLSASDIAKIVIGTTKRAVTVGDVFALAGDDVSEIVFEGGSERFDSVGAGLIQGGTITVHGDAGAYVARSLKGGRVRINGSVGPYAGSGMTGGRLEISGDSGDFTGGARAGDMLGMAGGIILVEGGTGARTGDRMKRGLIVALGGTGEATGSRMIGGTILTDRLGPDAGMLMKRGTLIANSADSLLPTFVESGAYQGAFLGLFQRWISEEVPQAEDLLFGRAKRFRGDMASLGKGELLIPA